MYQTSVLQQKAMNRSPVNPAPFQREILEIPTSVRQSFGVPHFSKLHTSSKVEIPHERTGLGDDFDKCLSWDVLVEF